MNKRRIAPLLLCIGLLFGSLPAAAPSVNVQGSSIAGNTVTVAVHNSGGKVVVRVGVTVLLVNGSQQMLTSPSFTILPNTTVYVTLTASAPIVSIGDDPTPFVP